MPSSPSKYVFSTDSLLYSYYLFIRRVYGCEGAPQKTNLCPGFWAIVGGTVGIALLWPLMILGWIAMKFSSWAMQWDYVEDTLEKSEIGDSILSMPESFKESPLIFGPIYAVMAVASIGLIAGGIYVLGTAAWHISDILHIIFDGFCRVGWLVFLVFYGVGFLLSNLYEGALWFFTNGELWASILKWGIYGIIGCAVAVTIGVSAMAVSKTAFFRRLIEERKEKRLKKSAAAKLAKEAKEKIAKAKESKARWVCDYCSYENRVHYSICENCYKTKPKKELPKTIKNMFGLFSGVYNWTTKIFRGETKKIGNGTVEVLGFFSMIWAFLKARKAKMCPTIYFVSPEDLRQDAIDAGKALKDKNEQSRLDLVTSVIDLRKEIEFHREKDIEEAGQHWSPSWTGDSDGDDGDDDEGYVSEMSRELNKKWILLKDLLGEDHPEFKDDA